MPQISPLEILMVAVIALIVFGPDKLPGIARNVGRTLNDLRRMATEMRSEFKDGLDVGNEPEDSKGSKPAEPGDTAEPAEEHPVAQAIRADAAADKSAGENGSKDDDA